ncbi:oxidoreductase domain protein [Parafrankia sp. EAN1pec]|nr:oxidoreductase domain protein [Frankia sp. EAN1pec]
MSTFPEGFLWGASTAPHQVEGGNINSDMWHSEWAKNSTFAEPSGDACDHYHRYPEDIATLAGLGLNAYRFGIEWARIEPIANGFAQALGRLPDVELVAVGSRHQRTADEFGAKFGVPPRRSYGSYEELAADDGVDVVYVASPHSHHHRHTLLFLNAGRGVLCEKPFALDANQAADMVATARARGQFLMEAMWSRFLPAYVRIRELVTDGTIGTVLAVDGDFGFRLPMDPSHRLFDPAQGGGALLDLGVYPLSLTSMLLGEPNQVAGRPLPHPGEVHQGPARRPRLRRRGPHRTRRPARQRRQTDRLPRLCPGQPHRHHVRRNPGKALRRRRHRLTPPTPMAQKS